MKYTKFFILIMISCFLVFACKDDDPVDPEPLPGEVVTHSITSPALQGNALGDPHVRDVDIWLPQNYDQSDKSYPVLYLLHGTPFGNDAFTQPDAWEWFEAQLVPEPFFATGNYPEEGFEAWMDTLMADPAIDEMIIVTPDAASSYGVTMYTNSPVHGDYEEFIAVDLVNYIDNEFRTIPDKQHRYIAGHCQSGYGALRIIMNHPDVFSKVAAMSPFIWVKELFNPAAIIAENPDGLNGPHPDLFATSAMYGFAAAWSPNLNAPFYVDLPFNFETGEPVMSVIEKWESQNLLNLLPDHITELRGLSTFYMDCGVNDELASNLTNQVFHDMLTTAEVEHTFEYYEGTHVSHIYDRIENILRVFSVEQ